MRAILTKWTLELCVQLKRRWTLPSKLPSLQEAKRTRSERCGSGATSQRSGGSSKRQWFGICGACGAGAGCERRPTVWLAAALLERKMGRRRSSITPRVAECLAQFDMIRGRDRKGMPLESTAPASTHAPTAASEPDNRCYRRKSD